MTSFRWNAKKNLVLDAERGIAFERIVVAIGDDGLLDVLDPPNRQRYPGQRTLVVACDDHAYLVPYVKADDHLFLKTIIPSRKATRDYLRRHAQQDGEQAVSTIDDDEQENLEAYDSGVLRAVGSPDERARLREAARATGTKDRRVNIRLSSADLHGLQTRALQEGVPYQTLITSVLHKYTSGRLVEDSGRGNGTPR